MRTRDFFLASVGKGKKVGLALVRLSPWPECLRAPNDGAAARKTLGGSPPFPVSLPGVTAVHVHLEPYRELKPAMLEAMERTTPGFEGLARATAAAGGLLEGLAAP